MTGPPDPVQGSELSDDLRWFDGTEAVTVTQTSTATAEEVAAALKRPLSLGELEASAGSYVRGDVKFHLPADALTFTPAAGDTITDAASGDWSIEEVEQLALGTRYRCWCKPV